MSACHEMSAPPRRTKLKRKPARGTLVRYEHARAKSTNGRNVGIAAAKTVNFTAGKRFEDAVN